MNKMNKKDTYKEIYNNAQKEILIDLKTLIRNLGKSKMINKSEIQKIIEKWDTQ